MQNQQIFAKKNRWDMDFWNKGKNIPFLAFILQKNSWNQIIYGNSRKPKNRQTENFMKNAQLISNVDLTEILQT